MDFLVIDWLGTPVWFWLVFLGLVVALTAFDLGVLHKEDKEMGIAESLKLGFAFHSKTPEIWADLPRSSVGKVLRKQVRDTFWARDGRQI